MLWQNHTIKSYTKKKKKSKEVVDFKNII